MNGYNELIARYFPITADPNSQSNTYSEVFPCEALRPYIRCFWGTTEPICNGFTYHKNNLVIPDTCMDIIFNIDYTKNTSESGFCTIDEFGHYSQTAVTSAYSIFAIRFYAWSAVLFADNSFWSSKNKYFDTDEFFSGFKEEITPVLINVPSLQERSEFLNKYLLKKLNTNRINSNMMNAIYDIINTRGTITSADLAAQNAISQRQLERIFNENMGISPKSFSLLIRYQMMWQEMYFKGGNLLDMTEKYGYYDEAHLLNDFRKRHSMTPNQAILFARK